MISCYVLYCIAKQKKYVKIQLYPRTEYATYNTQHKIQYDTVDY